MGRGNRYGTSLARKKRWEGSVKTVPMGLERDRTKKVATPAYRIRQTLNGSGWDKII